MYLYMSSDAEVLDRCGWGGRAFGAFACSVRLQSTRSALGYEPLGLPDLTLSGEFASASVTLLFPFPSSPERVSKNWKFARYLFPNIENSSGHNLYDLK